MNVAITMGFFAAVAVFTLGSAPAHAADMDDFRWDHDRADCRVIEIQTPNRWGTDITIRRRVCG
jgi:hypothetical protein